MNIKFENGSEIQTIDTKDETKRGCIRGRRLTIEEYNRMIDVDIKNAENKVSELIEYLDVDKYYKRHPSEFIENFMVSNFWDFRKNY